MSSLTLRVAIANHNTAEDPSLGAYFLKTATSLEEARLEISHVPIIDMIEFTLRGDELDQSATMFRTLMDMERLYGGHALDDLLTNLIMVGYKHKKPRTRIRIP